MQRVFENRISNIEELKLEWPALQYSIIASPISQ
jgi:hypothetical protein